MRGYRASVVVCGALLGWMLAGRPAHAQSTRILRPAPPGAFQAEVMRAGAVPSPGQRREADLAERERRRQLRSRWHYGPQLGFGAMFNGSEQPDTDNSGFIGRINGFVSSPRFSLFSVQLTTGFALGPRLCRAPRGDGADVCGRHQSFELGGMFRIGPMGGRSPFLFGLGTAFGPTWLGDGVNAWQWSVRSEIGWLTGYRERFEIVLRTDWSTAPELDRQSLDVSLMPSFAFP